MPPTQTELQCTLLGFNETFAAECELVLSAFRRVSPSLRNACIRIIASRHSLYVGHDETKTRAVDLKRIRLCPYLQPQMARDPIKYVRRLSARMGRMDLLPECQRVIANLAWHAPFLSARETAIASLVIADESINLESLAFFAGVSECFVTKLVATALEVSFSLARSILRPTTPHPRPRIPHLQNVDFTVYNPSTSV